MCVKNKHVCCQGLHRQLWAIIVMSTHFTLALPLQNQGAIKHGCLPQSTHPSIRRHLTPPEPSDLSQRPSPWVAGLKMLMIVWPRWDNTLARQTWQTVCLQCCKAAKPGVNMLNMCLPEGTPKCQLFTCHSKNTGSCCFFVYTIIVFAKLRKQQTKSMNCSTTTELLTVQGIRVTLTMLLPYQWLPQILDLSSLGAQSSISLYPIPHLSKKWKEKSNLQTETESYFVVVSFCSN